MAIWDKVKGYVTSIGVGAKAAVAAAKEHIKNVEVGPPDAPSLTDVVSGNNKKPAAKKPATKKK